MSEIKEILAALAPFGGNKIIMSVMLVVAGLLLRWLLVRLIRRYLTEEETLPKRWINTVTNITSLLIILGLVLVWLSELRFIALSVAAFVVALVVATREQIQCFLGALYIASSRAFSVGDWIKIGGHYGEVVSSDWLSTTLLEVDMETMSYGYTGRTLILPNNQFIAGTVQNLNFMRRYVAHSFQIILEPKELNMKEAKQYALGSAQQYCRPFKTVAERYSALIEKRLGITLNGPDASVRIQTNSGAKSLLVVTIFCPTGKAVELEQQITEDFMDYYFQQLQKNRKGSESASKE